jgi:hypothetical protein
MVNSAWFALLLASPSSLTRSHLTLRFFRSRSESFCLMSTKLVLLSVLAPDICCNPCDLTLQFVGIGQIPLYAVDNQNSLAFGSFRLAL